MSAQEAVTGWLASPWAVFPHKGIPFPTSLVLIRESIGRERVVEGRRVAQHLWPGPPEGGLGSRRVDGQVESLTPTTVRHP